jgi:hypothetical protein
MCRVEKEMMRVWVLVGGQDRLNGVPPREGMRSGKRHMGLDEDESWRAQAGESFEREDVAHCSVWNICTRPALRNSRTQLTPQDLFNIQPKRANWDLKRDMTNRMAKLERRTNEAIATIFREWGSSLYRRADTSSCFHPSLSSGGL